MGRVKVKNEKNGSDKPKKKFRWHPGTKALREIRRYQKTTDFLLPKAPFVRLVREIMQDQFFDGKVKVEAMEALQEGAESYLVDLFHRTNLQAIHADRKTVFVTDMAMARYQKGEITEGQIPSKNFLKQEMLFEAQRKTNKKTKKKGN